MKVSLNCFLFLALTLRLVCSVKHNFTICTGEFALCASALCYPTGETMKVNNTLFPEMSCLCPVFTGRALADLAGGNMGGSCAPFSSLFAPQKYQPQEKNNWKCTEEATKAPVMYCSLNDTAILGSDVNCFSFMCKKVAPIHGIEMANCSCPLLENINGERNSGKRFVTQAGQGNLDFCTLNPVGLPTLALDFLESEELFPIWQMLNNATLVSKTCSLNWPF